MLLDRDYDLIKARKIPIVQTQPPDQFPESLDRIEVRAVRWQKVQRKVIGVLVPPRLVEDRVMISGVVGNDDDAPATPGTADAEVLQKDLKALGIEAMRLPAKHHLAIPQTNGPKVADAATGRMVQHDGIGVLRGHPHTAARTMLLEMDFIRGPQVNPRITHQPSEFFYIAPEPRDRHGQ